MTSRTVHLDNADEAGGASVHNLNVSCAKGSEIRYSWRSQRAIRFSITDASGQCVRVLSSSDDCYSIYTTRSDGTHTLRWTNTYKPSGTDLTYNVKVVHPNALGISEAQEGGDPNALTLDEIAIVGIAVVLASAFSIGMMLGALHMRGRPRIRPGPKGESYCLRAYSHAYSGFLPPPEGPSSGPPR